MDIRCILNNYGFGVKEGDSFVSGILTRNISDVRDNTPVITKDSYLKDPGNKTHVMSIVSPTSNSCVVLKTIHMLKSDLYITEVDSYLNRHTHTQEAKINRHVIQEAIDIVNTTGSMSIETTEEELYSFLTSELFRSLYTTKYKYGSVINNSIHDYGRSSRTTETVCTITIIDVKHCFPIYDSRNVNGIVMLLTVMGARQGRTDYSHILSVPIVMTNYPENIYSVDGEHNIRKDCISSLLGSITNKLRITHNKNKPSIKIRPSDTGSGYHHYNLFTATTSDGDFSYV